jgi:hypothetical protein
MLKRRDYFDCTHERIILKLILRETDCGDIKLHSAGSGFMAGFLNMVMNFWVLLQ